MTESHDLLGEERISKASFNHIESELRLYHETKHRIMIRREEILFIHIETDTNVGGGKSNSPSDPTYKKASALESDIKLKEMQRIAEAIEYVWSGLDDDKKKLLKLYYWTRPQTLTWEGIAIQLHVTSRTAKRWRNQVIKQIASFLGWR
jgi:RinA family phage transcriptional activator